MPFFKLVILLIACTFSLNLSGQSTQPPAPSDVPVMQGDNSSRLKITGNLEICKGTETILKAEGNFESYSWSKGGVTGQYLKVSEEGVYEVTARTKGGCTYTASVTVRFRPCPV
ncbi:MAG: hypothetical protein JNJ57_12315 [Saprospiraceae bacterium]|nr:hypothetical protein [Saprospiraceae bacterium]